MGRKKPKTQAQILAEIEANLERRARERAAARAVERDPNQWGADPRALRAQPDVQVIMETKTKVQTAQRQDVFDRLLARGGLSDAHHTAVRRLETDMAERRGEVHCTVGMRVDQSLPIPVSDRSIDAAKRIEAVLAMVGRRDAELLRELLEPRRVVAQDAERWRAVVRVITGEAHLHVQAGAVRAACENLALAYREHDHQPKRAA